jgi:tetratricopeptide (TPR) repeat protein
VRIPPRLLFALSLWLAAAAIGAVVLAGRQAPEALVDTAIAADRWLRTGLLWLGLLTGVLLVLWPPFLPGLALGFRRLRERMSVDHRALAEAADRLRHYENATDLLAYGRLLLRQGNLDRAIAHFARAHELQPEHLPTRDELGRALLRRGAAGPAATLLRTVHDADPRHGWGGTAAALGEALLRTGDAAGAAAVLERLVATYPGHRRGLWFLARAQRALGQPAAEREALRRAAAPPEAGTRLSAEDRWWRARARFASWLGRR